MADGIDEVGLVHRVEMQVGGAAIDQVEHLFGADGGRDEAARRDVVLQPLKTVGQPLRHARAGLAGEIRGLLEVLDRLVESGNTMIVIEHNLDVIKFADYIVDMGPEGGDGGGEIIAEGTPEEVAENERSHTGRFLRHILVNSNV